MINSPVKYLLENTTVHRLIMHENAYMKTKEMKAKANINFRGKDIGDKTYILYNFAYQL